MLPVGCLLGKLKSKTMGSLLRLWCTFAFSYVNYYNIRVSIVIQPKSWYSFYRPTEGGRLSRPRHCRKGVQPVPKTVHRSGCCDEHNWPRPLTQQSIMPSLNHCDLLRHLGVNNLPKVVTRQRHGWELNSQPASCKSNALATRLSSHPHIVQGMYVVSLVYGRPM